MRGYYGIGAEGISKAMNAGNLFRSANAFGASFAFTVGATYARRVGGQADTSNALGELPFYEFDSVESMMLPDGCRLVGVELADDATPLPSFRHPRQAAYVLGMERDGLSPALAARCEFMVKIPTRFSLNLATAGAIVMYDRMLSMQRFGDRPVAPGGPIRPVPPSIHGAPIRRRKADESPAR